ncbi:hypothetical protein Tco_0140019 [Tanacetum coccineum]
MTVRCFPVLLPLATARTTRTGFWFGKNSGSCCLIGFVGANSNGGIDGCGRLNVVGECGLTDMVKHDVEIETLGESIDEIDKLAELIGEMQLKQEDRSCVHASNELHLHVFRCCLLVVSSFIGVTLALSFLFPLTTFLH